MSKSLRLDSCVARRLVTLAQAAQPGGRVQPLQVGRDALVPSVVIGRSSEALRLTEEEISTSQNWVGVATLCKLFPNVITTRLEVTVLTSVPVTSWLS